MRYKKVAAMLALAGTLGIAGCSNMTPQEKKLTGQIAGGVTGAAIGSLIGGGTGRVVAVGAGAVLGTVLGGNVAERY
jgi:outer membrane lipoprotein SlyB